MSHEPAKILDDQGGWTADMHCKDGLENLVAQLGGQNDKRTHARFTNSRNLSLRGNELELEDMYRTDWFVGKVVDAPADDATREWRKFNSDMSPEMVLQIEDEEERLGLQESVNDALKMSRLYGTSLIVMSIDDGQAPDRPLNLDRIKPGGLRHIKVADRHRIEHTQQTPVIDPLSPIYGMPQFYRFNETSTVIHASRVIRFDAVKLPFNAFRRQNYFSDSVIDRIYETVMNFNTATHSTASMIYETNVDIYKVDGLMDYLQTAEGEALIKKRFMLSGALKSFINAQLLDTKEDWMNKTNSFSGLPEIIAKFIEILAAASDIPATRLLGMSANGLNATGEGDLKNYYDMVASQQRTKLKPKLDYFDQIMIRSMGLPVEQRYTYKFNSLFQVTPAESAEIGFKNAQRDALYIDRQVISERIVAEQLMEEKTYTNIDEGWIAELRSVEGFDEPEEEGSTDGNSSSNRSDGDSGRTSASGITQGGASTRPNRLLQEETSEQAPSGQRSSQTQSSARS